MLNARHGHVGQGLIALALSAGAAGVWASGCAEAETSYGGDRGNNREESGNGGAMATGGVDSGTGGQSASTGGSATGGAPGSGGVSGRGGTSTGGLSATGGRASTGGAPTTGGTAPSTGGRSATGGAPATGGAVSSTGGVVATGGVSATGGSTAAGGKSSGVPDNVLMSYSFEQSKTDGWRGRGAASVTVSDEQAHTGSSALKVTNRTAAWHGAEYDVMSLVTAGDSYDVTAWARLTEGSASATLILTREVQGCDIDEFVRLDIAENATNAEWVELSGTLTLPASCAPSRLLVYVESDDPTASYYVDDTSMCPR